MGKENIRLALFIDNIITYVEHFEGIYKKLLELMSFKQDHRIITANRQKKPLQHNVTGRACRGDTRGLTRLPQVAADVPEGYSVVRGFPLQAWGLNPKLGSPAYSTRARDGPSVKSTRVSVCQGEKAGDTESLLKG